MDKKVDSLQATLGLLIRETLQTENHHDESIEE